MKKKLILILVIITLALAVAIFIPGFNLNTIKEKLFGSSQNISSMKVYSLGGTLEIFIDGSLKGKASSDESYKEIIPISSGKHEVRLKRDASSEGFYENFLREINFEKGFDTVISWEAGPTAESSSGWVLYAEKGTEESSSARLNLDCDPSDCNVLINGSILSQAPLANFELSLSDQYTILASREGYQDIEFKVLPEDQTERAHLEGYKLFLEVKLYKLPLAVTN